MRLPIATETRRLGSLQELVEHPSNNQTLTSLLEIVPNNAGASGLSMARCGVKTNLIWNDGKTESGKMVKVLATMPLYSSGLKELREVSEVIAVAVPFGESWKIYNMKDDGKMVRCGRAKTWPSLVAVKSYFEAL